MSHASRSREPSSVLIFLDLSAAFDRLQNSLVYSHESWKSWHSMAIVCFVPGGLTPLLLLHADSPLLSHMAMFWVSFCSSSVPLYPSYLPHIAKLTHLCRFHLYDIRRIQTFLSAETTQVVVQYLVNLRPDHCISLMACLSRHTIPLLQLIQNATACLVFNSPHIIWWLCSLYWLLVAACI